MIKTIEVEPVTIDIKKLLKRSARESDVRKLCKDQEAIIVHAGKVVGVVGKFHPLELLEIKAAIKSVPYDVSERTAGLKSTSRIFGFMPRNTIRKDFCAATAMAFNEPKQHKVFTKFAKLLAEKYFFHANETYRNHTETVRKEILPEWVIPETPFTSGIVNKNNPLKYHYDSGNYDGCFSCMLVIQKNIGGGHLSIPEWDLKFALPDGAFFLFDGQSVLHGVTPIKPLNAKSYRYSVVYYTLKLMKNCLPPDQEIKRIRAVKRLREQGRTDGNLADIRTK